MYKIACTKRELSCIISSIYEELLPVCDECGSNDNDVVVIKGRLVESGEIAVLKVTDYGCDFSGDISLLYRVRDRRCLINATSNITKES
jgi:hypothetical protein